MTKTFKDLSQWTGLFFFIQGGTHAKTILGGGKIVNTHGVTGEIKVQPWCDSPEVLTDFDTLYLSPTEPVQVKKPMYTKTVWSCG